MIIRNKKIFLSSIIVIILTLMVTISFPHEDYFGKPNTWILGIPVNSFDGYNPVGIMSLAVLGVGLYLLTTSLNKYKPGLAFLAVFLFVVLPPMIFHFIERA